ncbi:MAG: serine/threonine protein kinase [Labilithrix sp.]|nr:serine/threonine protein kinase [Labilithrix sp.]
MDKTEGTGERIGDYRVVRRLATGGTSDVLLARSDREGGDGELVVLKILLTKYERDVDLKAMFTREAAVYQRLVHPSVVAIQEYFAHGEKLVMVLDYVDGPPLSRLRGMLKTVGRQLDDVAALHVASCVFDALAAAHSALDDAGDPSPIVHRDVNPSNILVSWAGDVKLGDFGVAKVLGSSEQSVAGSIKGTYGYMAPEQAKGEPVTPRADVYAGAIVLWEMLTRRRAFLRGALPELEVLKALADPRIVPLDVLRPDLDPRLREAMRRALEPRAERRTITSEELLSTLLDLAPREEGRARLLDLLAHVRHEPKIMPTSMPPPLPADASEEQTAKFFAAGLKDAPAPSEPGSRPPAVVSPRLGGGSVVGRARLASTLSPAEIASVMDRDRSELTGPRAPKPPPSGADAALATPLADAISPGRALKDSIEEILGDVPSERTIASKVSGSWSQAQAPDRTLPLRPADGRPLGSLPEAPRALDPLRRDLNAPPVEAASRPPAEPDGTLRRPGEVAAGTITPRGDDDPTQVGTSQTVVPSGAFPSSFPAMTRTLSMLSAEEAGSAQQGASPEPPGAAPPPAGSSLTPRTSAAVPRPGSLPSIGVAAPGGSGGPPPLPRPSSPSLVTGGAARSGSSPSLGAPGADTPAPPSLPFVSAPTPPPARASSPLAAAQAASLASPDETQRLGLGGTVAMGTHPMPQRPGMSAAPAGPPRSGPPHSGPPHPGAPPQAAHPSNGPIPYHITERPVPRRSSGGLVVVALAAVGLLGGGAAVAYSRRTTGHAPTGTASVATTSAPVAVTARPTLTGSASATPVASAPAPMPTPSAPSATPRATTAASAASTAGAKSTGTAASAAPAADLSATTGRLKTAGTSPGRRIFVDDRTVGQTPESVVVKCGVRKVRVGSAGAVQAIDVPCGGEINVGDR